MLENGFRIGVEPLTRELVQAYPPEEAKEVDLQDNSVATEQTHLPTAFKHPLLRDVDLRRLTRKFHLVPGGEYKPRLDCGAKGTATWAIESVDELKDKKDERVAATLKRKTLEEKFMDRTQEESLFSTDPEIPVIKPEERIPELKDHSKVAS